METCCGDIRDMDCSINNILQRITPIEFIDNVFIVNSPVSVNTSLEIDGVAIGGENGVLSLPEGTTVGGVPLVSPHYVDGVYILPNKTKIGDYPILNTNYFYFYTTNLSIPPFQNGFFINNTNSTSSSTTFVPNYPFLVPNNCVLTSLLFSLMVAGAGAGITNAIATIYTISLTGVVVNTGISATIPACPITSRNFISITFQYPLEKGYAVGIKVAYSGSASQVNAFAILGYKFL